MTWDDLNARARGLGTHLLGRPRLEALARAGDLGELAVALEHAGFAPLLVEGREGAGRLSPAALEQAVARRAAARLATLARWSGPRAAALAVVFEDEDRRSVRALLRGAAAGAPPELRLAGLLPTPALPPAALRELAEQPSPGRVAALLAAWGHPYGAPLLRLAGRARPDLFALELAVGRRFAERAVAASTLRALSRLGGAGRGGGELLAYARQLIDLENAAAALVLAGGEAEAEPEACHLPGGERLPLPAFIAAASAKSRREAAARLAAAFGGTPFAAVFERAGGEPELLETRLLAAQIRRQARAARLSPLGPAPFLLYVLRLRAETLDLRRLLWGVALAAPRERLVERLVTAS